MKTTRKKRATRRIGLDEILQFVLVTGIVGIVLGYVAFIDPELPEAQRAITEHTALALKTVGIESEVFHEWVKLPVAALSKSELKDIELSFARLQLSLKKDSTYLVGYNTFLTSGEAQALHSYVNFLRSRGVVVDYSPSVITTPAITVEIIPACTGWLGIAAITALILAFPRASGKSRMYGLIITWGALYAVNVVRLASVIAVTNWVGVSVFDALHNVVWREGMITVALILWVGWLKYLPKLDE
ncbi:MAG: exosortase/archaeosortase family protein [Candidatus Diapherotrites archaeon]|nr:exosortase/archaeosortase family protein [Candidatus Diapherotrites archaeon]